MSLELAIINADTWVNKVETARKGIRAFIDDNTISLISSNQVSLIDYGDVCWALGFLATLAKDEAQNMDKKGG